jgi:penicillin amidase
MYSKQRGEKVKVGAAVGDPQEGLGSNNWTVAGSRSASGNPLLASDPHIAFGTLSCWYEVHLSGGSFNTVGMAYAGVPAVVMGRNEDVAWGITNNICSQRDLYLEEEDPQQPGSFLYEGKWEAGRTISERIEVRNSEAVVKTVQLTRNGPLVNHLLPEAARDFGPVSLRWLGATFCDELTPLLQANRARSNDEFREALRGWRVPTWNFVFADKEGHIGYQAVGHIPVREQWERGFRPGWEASQQWREVIPFGSMPAIADPPSGWIRTANNRNAPEDFPYPLSGTWSSGHRAVRIRQMLEGQPLFTFDDFRRMHHDVLALRAVAAVPRLLASLEGTREPRIAQAAEMLRGWDGRMEKDEVAASIFEVFFRHWSQAVAAERFPQEVAPLMAGVIGGLALELLAEDQPGWFAQGDRVPKIVSALASALDELTTRLGPDVARWQWGNLHTITLRHLLSGRGALSSLLDRGGLSLGGNGFTVCNTGYIVTPAGYEAASGANYRLIADFGKTPQGLWAVDAAGQSGNPGSAHYCDQLDEWVSGGYHFLPLERSEIQAKEMLRLEFGG